MNFFNRLIAHFSDRGKALSCYKRGMVKAKNHDHQGAIDDYTATLGMLHTPTDVKAMVLFNRALVFTAAGDDQKAIDDLDAVLAMDEAPAKVKATARQKLLKMESRSHTKNVDDAGPIPNTGRPTCTS